VPGFRAVGFDLDGTLFDHAGAAREGLDAFLTGLGAENSPRSFELWRDAENEHYEHWLTGRITFQEQRRRRLRSFLPAVGIAVPQSDAAQDELFGRYLDGYRNAWRLYPDAIPVLTSLRDEGTRIGVLTNGSGEQQRDKLAATGLLPLIDFVCVSEELGVAKPDPRAFQALSDGLGASPSDVIFVGDSERHDIQGAHGAGMRAGLVVHAQIGLAEAIATASPPPR
jgi:putative hydrolase of the HAD superfamily